MSFYCPNIDTIPAILKRIRNKWERDKSIMQTAGDAFSEICAYHSILWHLWTEQENITTACGLSGEPEPFLEVYAELNAVNDVYPQSKTPEGGIRYSNPSRKKIDKFIESGPGELMLLDFQTGKYVPVNPRCAFSVQKWLDKNILFLESPRALAIDTTVPAGKRKTNKAQDGLPTGSSRKSGRYPAFPYRKALVRVLFAEGISSPMKILMILQEYEDYCQFETDKSFDFGNMNRNTIRNDIDYLKQNKEICDKRAGKIGDNCVTIKDFKKWLETIDK